MYENPPFAAGIMAQAEARLLNGATASCPADGALPLWSPNRNATAGARPPLIV
jgi:hypothetical protein